MSIMVNCECGKRFNSNNYYFCPSCDKPVKAAMESVQKPKSSPIKQSDPLVLAQDRTTHAVRSLAITFVATPIIGFVLTFYLAYALRIEDMLQVGVGLTLGVIALVWTAYEALQELGKSRVPNP
jgi:hypothetical protein